LIKGGAYEEQIRSRRGGKMGLIAEKSARKNRPCILEVGGGGTGMNDLKKLTEKGS